MPRAFKLPDLGEGIHEGEVVAIHVSAGDHVKEGDIILEIETDKATVDIPSPFTGNVIEVLVGIGEIIIVGSEMIRFDDSDGTPDAKPTPSKASKIEAAEDQKNSNIITSAKDNISGPIPASPATRRLARQLNIDLAQVPASGPSGLVTAEDVHAFAQEIKSGVSSTGAKSFDPFSESQTPYKPTALIINPPPLPDFEKYGQVERMPLRSIRRATAKQMTLAWSEIPHVTSQDIIDVTELEKFRQKHKNDVFEKGGRLTFTVLALQALVVALKVHPRANASLDTDNSEVVLKKYYHIGVAINTEKGLMVPVIRDVDKKSIMELSIELDKLAKRARKRDISLDEMRGSTFTLTNMGAIGGGSFTPIINYPNVAIMGFGQARWQPAVRENSTGDREIIPRFMIPAVMTIDHRVMDGVDAVRFIEDIKQCLEDPEWLFINMT